MPADRRKYATLLVAGVSSIRLPMVKRGVPDFAVGADWTPQSGDVKLVIDGAGPANITNLPIAVACGNAAYWEFILTAAELTGKSIYCSISDAATKAVEDNAFTIETFGDLSAMYPEDVGALDPDILDMGTAQAVAAGSLTLRAGAAFQNADLPGATLVILAATTGAGQSRVINSYASSTKIASVDPWGTALTGTVRYALFATPPATVALPDVNVSKIAGAVAAVPGAAGGGLIAGANAAATFATFTVTGAMTVNGIPIGQLSSGERDAIATALLKLDWTGITGEASRSLLNAARFLRNKFAPSGSVLTIYKEDGTTPAYTRAITATPGADPISGLGN